MNRKFRSRQSLSLLPLSLLILSGNLKAGLVSAQTVKSEEVEENSQLAAELGDAVGAATAEREAIHEQRADRKTSQGLKSLANSESPLKWTEENSAESVISPLERTLAVSRGINSLASERVDIEANEKPEELKDGASPSVRSPLASLNKGGTGNLAPLNKGGSEIVSYLDRDANKPLLAPLVKGVWGDLPQIAQVPTLPNRQPDRTPPPSQEPIAPQTPAPLPPPEELLLTPSTIPPTPESVPGKVPESIEVERFEFEGNTAISNEDLAKVTAKFTKRRITFAELFQARSAVTEEYIKRGYITSGALIPPQKLQDGVVKIQVVEGGLESINVIGTRRLNPNYVRSRLSLATEKPLNRDRLLEALQLLQLNPLIQNLSAELAAGTQPGLNLLEVQVTEAKTFTTQIGLDNNRAPSIGSFRRRIQVNQANLSGQGDALNLGYSNTVGSNGIDLSYTRPINPRNGTLRFSYGITASNVVEPPFNRIDIEASSRYYELTLRQPLLQTPSQEFAIGLTATRQESDTSVLEIPFPLSPGADDQGRTRISTLRFFQEWTKRTSQEVIAARSQFNLGLGLFNATINNDSPDSRFLSWRGQAQWVRLLAPETLFLLRADVQLADRTLVPLEQFGLGGQESVRGYRQDVLLTDNGALASAEVRFPIARIRKWNTLVQLAPFLDFGSAWSSSGKENPDPNILASAGLGLQVQIGDRLSMRLDYGIPLVSVSTRKRTWQENGLYFSIIATPF
jgi:hemolysin activation/secretion protein